MEQLQIRVEELERSKLTLERKQIKDEKAIKQLELSISEQKQKIADLQKYISKQNYEAKYPAPEILRDHMIHYQKSFNIQFLGSRGSGKSTLCNKAMLKMGILRRDNYAATGPVETTGNTQFFAITNQVADIPHQWDEVFLVDQPGIGGNKVKEDQYLKRYGPGLFKT